MSGVYGGILGEVGKYHLLLMSGVRIVLMVKVMRVMTNIHIYTLHIVKLRLCMFVYRQGIFVMKIRSVLQVKSIALRS